VGVGGGGGGVGGGGVGGGGVGLPETFTEFGILERVIYFRCGNMSKTVKGHLKIPFHNRTLDPNTQQNTTGRIL